MATKLQKKKRKQKKKALLRAVKEIHKQLSKKGDMRKCTTCKEPMKVKSTDFRQAAAGPIAGHNITKYECKNGHIEEDSSTED